MGLRYENVLKSDSQFSTSAMVVATITAITLGSLRYGDYGLRLRLNMLLRMIKTT